MRFSKLFSFVVIVGLLAVSLTANAITLQSGEPDPEKSENSWNRSLTVEIEQPRREIFKTESFFYKL